MFLYKSPYKVIITVITIWAFLFNTFGMELAWAAKSPSPVLPASGTDNAGSPGHTILPKDLGEIKERHIGANKKTVIYIQDAHSNYSCQKSIRDIIDHFNHNATLALLEGGAGDYDLSVFTRIEDKELRKKTADYFLKEGRINGAEFFAINDPRKIMLKGLEKPELYKKNLKIYRDSLKQKDEVDDIIKTLNSYLSSLKDHIYPDALREFEEKRTAYSNTKLGLGEYLGYMAQLSGRLKIRTSDHRNISSLIRAKKLEKEINFKTANYERQEFISELEKRLPQAELEKLIKNASGFKDGALKETEFYSYLSMKAETVTVDICKKYPAFSSYKKYKEILESIGNEALFSEIGRLEGRVIERLCRKDSQKKLYLLSKNLSLLKDFFNISLTSEKYEYYRTNKDHFRISRFQEFIKRYARLYGIETETLKKTGALDRYREGFERFYEYALERDKAFIENITRYCGEGVEERGLILVTGGFHTTSMKRHLRDKGYSYTVILPKFNPAEKTPYFKLLSGGLSPVEEEIRTRTSAIPVPGPFCEQIGKPISIQAVKAVEREIAAETAKAQVQEGKERKLARQLFTGAIYCLKIFTEHHGLQSKKIPAVSQIARLILRLKPEGIALTSFSLNTLTTTTDSAGAAPEESSPEAERPESSVPQVSPKECDIIFTSAKANVRRVKRVEGRIITCDLIGADGTITVDDKLDIDKLSRAWREKRAFILQKDARGNFRFNVTRQDITKTLIIPNGLVRRCGELGINIANIIQEAADTMVRTKGIEVFNRINSPMRINLDEARFNDAADKHPEDMKEFLILIVVMLIMRSLPKQEEDSTPTDPSGAAPAADDAQGAEKFGLISIEPGDTMAIWPTAVPPHLPEMLRPIRNLNLENVILMDANENHAFRNARTIFQILAYYSGRQEELKIIRHKLKRARGVLDPGSGYLITAGEWLSTDLPSISGRRIDEILELPYLAGEGGFPHLVDNLFGDKSLILIRKDGDRIMAERPDRISFEIWGEPTFEALSLANFNKGNGVLGVWFADWNKVKEQRRLPLISIVNSRDFAMTFTHHMLKGMPSDTIFDMELEALHRVAELAKGRQVNFAARLDLHDFVPHGYVGALHEDIGDGGVLAASLQAWFPEVTVIPNGHDERMQYDPTVNLKEGPVVYAFSQKRALSRTGTTDSSGAAPEESSSAESAGGKSKKAPIVLPTSEGIARPYRVWLGFEKAGDISGKRQQEIGVESAKAETTFSLITYVNSQYKLLQRYLPSLEQVNPAMAYDDPTVLNCMRFMLMGTQTGIYRDFLFVIDKPRVKLIVAKPADGKICPCSDDELDLFVSCAVSDAGKRSEFRALVKGLQEGVLLKDISSESTEDIAAPPTDSSGAAPVMMPHEVVPIAEPADVNWIDETEAAIEGQVRILESGFTHRAGRSYTIGVVVKAPPKEENPDRFRECIDFTRVLEQDARRLAKSLAAKRGINISEATEIEVIAYVDDTTQSDENTARLEKYKERLKDRRERNQDEIIFSFVLRGKDRADFRESLKRECGAYMVGLDGAGYISRWGQALLGPLFAVFIDSKIEEIRARGKKDGDNTESTIRAIVESASEMQKRDRRTVDEDIGNMLRGVNSAEKLDNVFDGTEIILYLPTMKPQTPSLKKLQRTEKETARAL